MATTKYLDSILRVMPAIQARQITDILNGLRVAGDIRDSKEYDSKLRSLSLAINATNPVPSFTLFKANPWSLCSSTGHNLMMQALKNDIETLFLQLDEIGKKIDDHHFLIMESLCHDLHLSLADQEAMLKKLEWMADKNNDFSYSLVNTFAKSAYMRMDRSDKLAKGLYYDNRTFIEKTEEELPSAFVDEYGQKLILKTNAAPIYPIAVKETNIISSYGTLFATSTQENKIENILDGTRGTYWTKDTYLTSPVEKVNTTLLFDLGSARDVSYIIVEVASSVFVESITGITPDGSRLSLVSIEKEVPGYHRFDFQEVFINSFEIIFSDHSPEIAQYFIPKEVGTFQLLYDRSQSKRLEQAVNLGPVIRDNLGSSELSDICNVPYYEEKQVNGYLYSITIDNVWAGNGHYTNDGIFVSKPLILENAGLLGLWTEEVANSNSIEYEIIKEETAPEVKQTRFSIPIFKQEDVEHERLILTEKDDIQDINDTGKLRFCPFINEDNFVSVYENGKLLVIGDRYHQCAGTDPLGNKEWNSDNTSYYNGNLPFDKFTFIPQTLYIRIKNPKQNAIYTVSYKIRNGSMISNTEEGYRDIFLDKDRNITLIEDNKVAIKNTYSQPITSNIYLQITLRRNTPLYSLSPEVHEYVILGSSYER